MKSRLSVLLLVGLLGSTAVTTPACVPKNVTTTAGKAAYTQDQVVIRLGELQSTVIDAALTGAMPLSDARQIVTWISGDTKSTPPAVGVLTIVKAGEAGWQSALRAGWPAIRVLIANTAKLNTLLPLFDAMIGGL